jgi:hypothetical protein
VVGDFKTFLLLREERRLKMRSSSRILGLQTGKKEK